jgi:hypothetical protein
MGCLQRRWTPARRRGRRRGIRGTRRGGCRSRGRRRGTGTGAPRRPPARAGARSCCPLVQLIGRGTKRMHSAMQLCDGVTRHRHHELISLTRVSRGSPDAVSAAEELPHHPRPDEAACSGHAHQLLATVVGSGRHGRPAGVCVETKKQKPLLEGEEVGEPVVGPWTELVV